MTDSWRGHPIHEHPSGVWRYLDRVQVSEEPDRPCGKCGEPNTPDGHDACLGELPGVMNACCGHGVVADAWVVTGDGRRLSGWGALEFFQSCARATKKKSSVPDGVYDRQGTYCREIWRGGVLVWARSGEWIRQRREGPRKDEIKPFGFFPDIEKEE